MLVRALTASGGGGENRQYLLKDGQFQSGFSMSNTNRKPSGWGGTAEAPTVTAESDSIHLVERSGRQGGYNADNTVNMVGKEYLVIVMKGTVSTTDNSQIGISTSSTSYNLCAPFPLGAYTNSSLYYGILVDLSQYQGDYYIMLGINSATNVYLKDIYLI